MIQYTGYANANMPCHAAGHIRPHRNDFSKADRAATREDTFGMTGKAKIIASNAMWEGGKGSFA